MIDVMSELKEAGDCYRSADWAGGFLKTAAVWGKIPEPKAATPNAYMVIEYAVAFALKMSNYEEAKKWAAIAPAFSEIRDDRGEAEFLIGKVAYESGDLVLARTKFEAAHAKSKGRAFQDEDPKYRRLINKK